MTKRRKIITKEQLEDLDVGDRVIRMLRGRVAINMIVINRTPEMIETQIDNSREPSAVEYMKSKPELMERFKSVGYKDEDANPNNEPVWTFNASTGGEIDRELGWDGVEKSGSYLTLEKE